ncbi:MAG: hypothetical protein J2P16_07095 [Mycobacterium sp.]|nr:hypothetical protein [Mycobacterium sp.]
MSWLRARPNTTRQPCPLPSPRAHRPRSVWLCDTCGRRWVLRADGEWLSWEHKVLPWPPRPPGRRYPGHPLIDADEG